MQFGETFAEAKARAGKRLAEIEDAMEALTKVPHQGTLQPKLLPGLRCVTKERAVFYFIVDEDQRVVRVLAVFFGGQDHQRRMLRRLSKRDKP
jgi:plasmid stabilization system protein ParE